MTRRHLLSAAFLVVLIALPIALYFIVWLPNSLRNSLDRIEIGMGDAEAKEILADFLDEPDRWPAFPTIGEVWSARDGDVQYVKWEPPTKVYMLLRMDGNPPNQIAKSTSRGIAYIDFEDGRVIGKTWLEFPQPSLVEWFRTRFR